MAEAKGPEEATAEALQVVAIFYEQTYMMDVSHHITVNELMDRFRGIKDGRDAKMIVAHNGRALTDAPLFGHDGVGEGALLRIIILAMNGGA